MGDLTQRDEADVERGHAAAGDSLEQRDAEKVAIQLLGEKLGVVLTPRRLPLPDGGRIELDGVSDQPPILVEVWAHQGPPKAAQKAKVMTDAMRLLFAARVLGTAPRLILGLTDRAAAAHFTGRTWMSQALRELGVEVEIVELPEPVRESVLRAQARQYR
jgi:hypothetical protein